MTRLASGDYSASPNALETGLDALDEDELLGPDLAVAGVVDAPCAVGLAPLPELIGRVPETLAGERFDKVLAKLFPAYSRARLQDWIERSRVTVDGAPARLRMPAPPGALVRVMPDLLPEQRAFAPEPIPLQVIYEDRALAVIDKPAGLVVHPGAGNWQGTLLNGVLHRYADAAGLPRAGIVHRLDKDTSGLMVVARSLTAQTDLVRQLQARTVHRRYVALVWGTPAARQWIDAPLGRDPRDRLRMAVVQGGAGKPARTHLEVLATGTLGGMPVAALQCDLETGRTHQIRVHCASLGHPLVGDLLYGRARRRAGDVAPVFPRQALHAWRLGLNHPDNGAAMGWESPPPADLAGLFQQAGIETAAFLPADRGPAP